MIILDVNIILYAVNENSPLHARAKAWLEGALCGGETVGFSWTVLLAFVRLTTRTGLFSNPMPVDKAFDLIDAWLEQPSAIVVDPGPRHATILRKLLSSAGTGGNLTSDAHLAALALEYGAEVCSLDRDFMRFPGLKWRDPL